MANTFGNFNVPEKYQDSVGSGVEYLSIPKVEIPALAIDYVAAMEMQRTNDWCKCEWIIHPDDVELDTHNCHNCHHPRLLHTRVVSIDPGGEVSGYSEHHPCTKIIDDHHDESPIPQKSYSEDCLCEDWVDPPKRRMRRGDTHPECAVHTKEGFILGFFEWVFKDDIKNTPNETVDTEHGMKAHDSN